MSLLPGPDPAVIAWPSRFFFFASRCPEPNPFTHNPNIIPLHTIIYTLPCLALPCLRHPSLLARSPFFIIATTPDLFLLAPLFLNPPSLTFQGLSCLSCQSATAKHVLFLPFDAAACCNISTLCHSHPTSASHWHTQHFVQQQPPLPPTLSRPAVTVVVSRSAPVSHSVLRYISDSAIRPPASHDSD